MNYTMNIRNEPYGVQPTNSSHIWVLESEDAALKTDFKYVVDFYLNPTEFSGQTKFGRIKVSASPNFWGKFDAREIIKNEVVPQLGTDREYILYSTSTDSWVETFGGYGTGSPTGSIVPNAWGIHRYNKNWTTRYAGQTNITPPQIATYGLSFGIEYTENGETILDILDRYAYPSEAMFSASSVVVPYPGSPTQISWSNMNLTQKYYSSEIDFNSGWTYTHTTSAGVLVSSGTSSADTGSYVSTLEPGRDDILFIYQNDTTCGRTYIWDNGWIYQDRFCKTGAGSSKPVMIFPGTKNVLDNIYTTAGSAGGMTQWEQYRYYFLGLSRPSNSLNELKPPKQFMTLKGGYNSKFDVSGLTYPSNQPWYKTQRNHHRDCPIILNWANWSADVKSLVELTGSTSNTLSFNKYLINPFNYDGGVSNFPTYTNEFIPSDSRILFFTRNMVEDSTYQGVNSIAFFLSNSTTDYMNWTTYGVSEILKFDLYDSDCLDGDPLHFVFLNSLGLWDTITFSQKNIRSFQSEKKSYQRNIINSDPFNSVLQWEGRNVPYDMNTNVVVEAQSRFVDESDVVLYKDFIMSPYVYLLSLVRYTTNVGGVQEYPTRWIPYPITITTSSVEEMKNRYNKLYQYSVIFEYNTPEQYFNQL